MYWEKGVQIWMLIGMTVLADICFYGNYPVGWTIGAYLLLLTVLLRPKRFDYAPWQTIVPELAGILLLALSFFLPLRRYLP